MILGTAASAQAQDGALRPQQAFLFGQAEGIMQAARMSNRLTGYVYLMDGKGRLRWQAAGPAKVCSCSDAVQAQPVLHTPLQQPGNALVSTDGG